MTFITTPRHESIFQWIADGSGNAAIKARAGTGKTTTMVEITKRILAADPTAKILAVAFNATIKSTLAKRMPAGVSCQTFNGLGWGALRGAYKGIQLNSSRTREMVRYFLDPEDLATFGPVVTKLVGLAKSHGLVTEDAKQQMPHLVSLMDDEQQNWQYLISHFEIDMPEFEGVSAARCAAKAIGLAREILTTAITHTRSADFDDQLWMTLGHDLPVNRYDWVIVDEAQDMNAIQHQLIAKSVSAEGRLIAVGDPAQAIYGFRGADSSSMDTMIQRFGMKVFDLPVTYRCPKAVVALAQKIVPDLEALPDAPEGQVISLDLEEVEFQGSSDLVVCRNTAPLIKLAHRLIRQRISCQVLGKDIGAGLASLVKKVNGISNSDLGFFLKKLDQHIDRQVKRLAEQDKPSQIDALQDKAEAIRIFAEDADSVEDLLDQIKKLFQAKSGQGALTLCTIHKAKGLEAPRVFILNSDLMPSRWARQPWQQQQEANLIYVAQTRAMDTLAHISI